MITINNYSLKYVANDENIVGKVFYNSQLILSFVGDINYSKQYNTYYISNIKLNGDETIIEDYTQKLYSIFSILEIEKDIWDYLINLLFSMNDKINDNKYFVAALVKDQAVEAGTIYNDYQENIVNYIFIDYQFYADEISFLTEKFHFPKEQIVKVLAISDLTQDINIIL